MRTGDIKLIKKVNEKVVLDLIRVNKIISGAELSRITGLQPSTILKILIELSRKDLILNSGKGESTIKGGKRPNLWKLNNSAAYVLGLDIEVNEITIVILDLEGNSIAHRIIKFEPVKDLHELVAHINNIINEIILQSGIDRSKIYGMGIAYAGVVNCEEGVVILGDVIPQMNVPLIHELKKYYNFPIMLENNANASAIGERWVGVAKNKKNFITLLIEFDTFVSGIGMGLVVNGSLYHGSSFCAGEINVHFPKLKDMVESIRHRFDESEIFKNYVSSCNQIDIHLAIDSAKKGDEIAITLFSILGNTIGKIIAKPIALFNPDAIIITGPLSVLGDIIMNPIREAIRMEILSITDNALEILCSFQGDYSVANGAASILLNGFFKHPLT